MFSDRTDIITAHTFAQAEKIAADSYPDCTVIGRLDSRAQAIRCRDILIADNVPKEKLQERLEQLIVGE
ncbi:hypothetical protein MMALV_08440 [Candidatus Methanomethylophilus alvi Mx1201]|uniref:Uncharacterized protein n=2 Tax=Methanomethylophilus alvi TaxID=1291540 RepID=M9SJ73_METAX|nr:hypothetical protein [Methanomethylophilus alvi]AGI85582.1 hypothetical protein MMALV_08440 [Candidatus Methanomethylophilus alvi Mx1201]AYQ54992.1 hypothetical protein BKD89_04130 [Methanomethylophilus alvi]